MIMSLSDQMDQLSIRTSLNSIYCFSKVLASCMDMLSDEQVQALIRFCSHSIIYEAIDLADCVDSILKTKEKESTDAASA